MNNKFIAIIVSAVVLAFYVGFLMATQSYNEEFKINSQNDLTEFTNDLTKEISQSQTFLTIADLTKMVGPDHSVDLITLFPNDMSGYSSSYGNSTKSKNHDYYFENGTRIYQEISHDGILLKEIKIYDVPEKTIMIIIKGD